MRSLHLSLCLVAAAACCQAQQNRGYYRFPAISGNTIAFTAEGDLWVTSIDGGVARRLTTHPGEETHAAFSPDGKTIAYSANYEGPTEVYSMPAAGGLPTRRTFAGNAEVAGWTPDGKILYITRRYSTLPDDQLATIGPDNRVALVPLSQASQGVYDPQGSTLFFTRLPFQGSQAKRYQGGTAQNIWKFAAGQEAVPLTADHPGTSKDAMYWNGRVYFLSDRDGTMNLWSMDANGRNLKQLTRHQGWDAQSPSLSEGRIVYQLGADLHLYDIAKSADKTINIELPSDFDHLREHWIKTPLEYTTSLHISADGSSLVATSRGRVFVIPAKNGRLVDVNEHKPGRYRDARMLPDGKTLLALSTETGETEFWKLPANGVGPGEQLTTGAKVLRWEGIPSPDGKWIAHQDKDNQLWLLDTAAKTEKKIDVSMHGDDSSPQFQPVRWSPDSRWLTYTKSAANQFDQVILYGVESAQLTPLTTDRYNSEDTAWSPDGKWIYLLSDRSLKTVVLAPWGPRQPDPFFDRSMKIYQLPLRKGLRSPFAPPDELHPDKPEEGARKPDEAKPSEKPKVEIDLDGIASRLEEVPVPAGNYRDLTATAKRLCWIDRDPIDPSKSSLACLDIANKGDKPESLMDGVRNYELSADGKKLFIRKQNDLYLVDSSIHEAALRLPKTLSDSHVDLRDWAFSVIPSDEFREEFQDSWRLHRDYFYDKHMHGVNWTAMRDKYSELVGRVRDRQELSDLLAQMVGELSALHTFVRGGDVRRGPDQVQLASLGAMLSRDPSAGGYVVQHIYRSDPDRPDKRPPLARPGVEVAEGDVIVAINGRDLLAAPDPGDLLRNQASKQVLLRVRPKGASDTRDVIVKPVSLQEESDLRYREWEFTRREKVEQASNGQMGYVHLRAMGPQDIDQWEEEYTPVFDRQGLIVDVRHNQGGNIDSWILGKLLRKAWMYWQPRVGDPYWNMQSAFRGHLVLLCDEWTGSDGEAFAEGFRRLGLGKIIGTRTWGGEIWLTGSNFLADRGVTTAAENGVYGPEGKWLIEGHGVDPDIVVDNLPHATFEGKDAQLEAAIQYLEELIRKEPVKVPPPPPYPDKTFHPRGGATATGGGRP
ncbi:MAG: PDZ domain-containing protein [Acidobacteriia bacterium]|nr:PDZ domain-containing protein [Terriglobia bacterium]